MSFKKDKRCPECQSLAFWHRPKIQIEIGYLGALWGTATTPGWLQVEQFTCAECGLTQFYAIDLDHYATNKHTRNITDEREIDE